MKNVEVELKYKLNNTDAVRNILSNTARLILANEHQVDTYYTPPDRNFLSDNPVKEWLRLRKSDKGVSLNYKHWHITSSENTVSCDEFETIIASYDQMKQILLSLGFIRLVEVDKTRDTWEYNNAEIAIDNVKGLGNFIEIQANSVFSSIQEAKEHLYLVANELKASFGEQEFRGYPYRLLEVQGYSFK